MFSGYTIRKNQYYDSVFLMGINKKLSETQGITQTAVLMGTDNNKQLLLDIGFKDKEITSARANDLIVGVIGKKQSIVDNLLADLDQILNADVGESPRQKFYRFEEGLEHQPDSNLAVISIPGEYVFREAEKALDAGLHVFIFSSNVPLEEEISLKKNAAERNLLVMGPDCGTSLIGGKGIGFANAVRRGPIGVIGASGTGIQEFTTQIHNQGSGISHAIGTGSKDVSDKVGGLTSFLALDILESDPTTEIIAFISKPPGPLFQEALVKRLEVSSKPAICCFLGGEKLPSQSGSLKFASTIDEAVGIVIQLVVGISDPDSAGVTLLSDLEQSWIENELEKLGSDQRYIRGIFAGGTFTYQSQKVLQSMGIDVFSNAPLTSEYQLENPDHSFKNSILDMGDELYTLGRPHPMIDGSLRKERIIKEGTDPEMAILFLDFILGYNSSPDPVGELLDAIRKVQEDFQKRGSHLSIVASICGTEGDAQDLDLQTQLLQELGAIVFFSNSKASTFCGEFLKRIEK